MPDRAHDLVVFGASGFVGELLAAYLAGAAPAGLRIALAGRSAERLAARAGCLTPAAGLGDVLVERLRTAGHRYGVADA